MCGINVVLVHNKNVILQVTANPSAAGMSSSSVGVTTLQPEAKRIKVETQQGSSETTPGAGLQ